MEVPKKMEIVKKKERSKEEKKMCMQPTNHDDKITLKDKGEIRKLPIVDAQCYWARCHHTKE